ncbi:hypothetical protein LSH36_151g05031 [Paralvinella palmiformis]|uniref:Uncharacterized protein n=1 Tax=Paralvinella palmiformis TaxID=53620 RepID=A0AAD9N920_9ANNE|nr:hypothetical protein LSH36_151g05031 [Paralvinella palmiformis]
MYPADTVTAYYMFLVEFDIAPWVHYIWIPIGVWQAIWITYSLVNLCRRDAQTGYAMYFAPGSIPLSTYGTYTCALVSQVCSQAALSNGILNLSFTFDLVTALTLFFSIYFSSRRLQADTAALNQTGRSGQVMLTRGLVHNGIGLYAGWADFMVFLKLGKLLVFYGKVDDATAGGVCLILYAFYLTVRLAIDMTLWDAMIRHLLTPYVTSVGAMVGVLTQNFDADHPTTLHYIIATVLGVVIMLAVFRIVEMGIRNRKDNKRAKSRNMK